jgi:hypothetical protein
MATFLAFNYANTLRSLASEQSLDCATNIASVIDQQLLTNIAALKVLETVDQLDNPPQISGFYTKGLEFHKNFGSQIILCDLSMRMLMNTRVSLGTPLPTLPEDSQPVMQTAVETGNPAIGNVFMGLVAKERLIRIAVPVIRDEQILYILASVIETRQFQKTLEAIALPSGRVVTVLDGANQAIAQRSTLDNGIIIKDSDRPQRFVAKSSVGAWSVALDIPEDIYRAPLKLAGTVLIASLLLSVLAVVVGGRMVALRLSD